MTAPTITYIGTHREARPGDVCRKSAGAKLFRVLEVRALPVRRVRLRGLDAGGSFWVDSSTPLVLVEDAP